MNICLSNGSKQHSLHTLYSLTQANELSGVRSSSRLKLASDETIRDVTSFPGLSHTCEMRDRSQHSFPLIHTRLRASHFPPCPAWNIVELESVYTVAALVTDKLTAFKQVLALLEKHGAWRVATKTVVIRSCI